MSNRENCRLGKVLAQRELNQHIRFHIYVRRGLVHQQEPRFTQHGPGQAEKLSLSGAKILAIRIDICIKTLTDLGDRLLHIDAGKNAPNELIAVLVKRVEIGTDSSTKECCVLRDDCKARAQVVETNIGEINAILKLAKEEGTSSSGCEECDLFSHTILIVPLEGSSKRNRARVIVDFPAP